MICKHICRIGEITGKIKKSTKLIKQKKTSSKHKTGANAAMNDVKC